MICFTVVLPPSFLRFEVKLFFGAKVLVLITFDFFVVLDFIGGGREGLTDWETLSFLFPRIAS